MTTLNLRIFCDTSLDAHVESTLLRLLRTELLNVCPNALRLYHQNHYLHLLAQENYNYMSLVTVTKLSVIECLLYKNVPLSLTFFITRNNVL